MQDTILSIAGKPGLYKLISQGRGMLIVEAIDASRRRQPAGVRDRVTSLNDVSMYTEGEDVPLMEVFQSACDLYKGAPIDIDLKKAGDKELAEVMAAVLPTYDRDRVYKNDIKKLIQWYNILVTNGYKQFMEAPADPAAAEQTEE